MLKYSMRYTLSPVLRAALLLGVEKCGCVTEECSSEGPIQRVHQYFVKTHKFFVSSNVDSSRMRILSIDKI